MGVSWTLVSSQWMCRIHLHGEELKTGFCNFIVVLKLE